MGMSPSNIFVGTNSILKQKVPLKRPKTHGLHWYPGVSNIYWNKVTRKFVFDWDVTGYGLNAVHQTSLGYAMSHLVPPWKKVNWKRIRLMTGFIANNPNQHLEDISQWETIWGNMPPEVGFIACVSRIVITTYSNRDYITKARRDLITVDNT